MSFTLSQLLLLSQNEKRAFKEEYRLEALKLTSGTDTLGKYTQFASVVLGGKEPRYSVVKAYSEDVTATSTAKVTCSCDYFRIRLAVSLFLSGATDMKVDKSDIPEKLSGLQKPGLCPHLLILVESILSMNTTEMKRLKQQQKRTNVNERLRRLT